MLAMLEKNFAFNLSGHVLHSLFWECLSPDGGGEPTGWLAEQIDADFGGFAPFQEHMTRPRRPSRDRDGRSHRGNQPDAAS